MPTVLSLECFRGSYSFPFPCSDQCHGQLDATLEVCVGKSRIGRLNMRVLVQPGSDDDHRESASYCRCNHPARCREALLAQWTIVGVQGYGLSALGTGSCADTSVRAKRSPASFFLLYEICLFVNSAASRTGVRPVRAVVVRVPYVTAIGTAAPVPHCCTPYQQLAGSLPVALLAPFELMVNAAQSVSSACGPIGVARMA